MKIPTIRTAFRIQPGMGQAGIRAGRPITIAGESALPSEEISMTKTKPFTTLPEPADCPTVVMLGDLCAVIALAFLEPLALVCFFQLIGA